MCWDNRKLPSRTWCFYFDAMYFIALFSEGLWQCTENALGSLSRPQSPAGLKAVAWNKVCANIKHTESSIPCGGNNLQVIRCSVKWVKQINGSWFNIIYSNPGYTYRLGNERLESCPTERGLGVLINSKLNMSQHRALAAKRANRALGGIKPCIAAGQGRGLSRSALRWCGLTLSVVCSFRHHRTLRI